MKDQQPAFFSVSIDEIGKRIVFREAEHGGRPHPDAQRDEMRQKIKDDVEVYIKAGGTVTSVPMGLTMQSPPILTSAQQAAVGAV